MVRSLQLRLARAVRRRSGASGAQGGFALVIVLGSIAVTSVLVVALLGLAMTSATITRGQAVAAREMRSADGALEGTIATLARSAGSGCTAVPPTGATVNFDNGTTTTADDDAVTVECAGATAGFDPAGPLGGNDVKIVGNGAYDGNTITGAPTLVASGSAPLGFLADVTVRRGASVSRSDSGGTPAVTASGQYVQGEAGPGGSGTDCTALAIANGTQLIKDRDSTPVCGDSAARGLTVSTQQLVSPNDTAAAPVRTTPACTVPVGGVVALEPGRYNAVETSALNQLLGGGCRGRTFWFKPSSDATHPGVFAFDANPNRFGGAALLIDDPTAKVVFGAPSGWDPAAGGASDAAFPQACSPLASGASIQLSGRMALLHRAGRVAVCPAWNGTTPLPALVQVAAESPDPITVAASSTDFVLAGGANGGAALLASPDDASTMATARFTCTTGVFSSCLPSKSFTASFANVPPAALTSAKVLVATRETPPAATPDMYRRVQIQVTPVSGPGCTTSFIEGGRTHWQLSAYDLLSDPSCRAVLQGRPGSVLEDAAVRLTYRTNPTCLFGVCPPSGVQVTTISVRGVRLITNATVAEATGASGSGWNSPANALQDDAAAAHYPQTDCGLAIPCSFEVPGTSRSLTLSGFSLASGTAGAPSTLRVLVKNRQAGTLGATWVADPVDDASTELTLTLASGQSCAVTYPGFSHSNQESQFDLLNSAQGGCAGVVTDLSQLQGASLKIKLTTGCAWVGATRLTPGADGKCGTVTLPDYQYVALTTTTTNTTTRPPRSEVTVNAAASGDSTDFHVYGDTVMPKSDLALHWTGTAPATPLFSGSLVVFGLGSDMASGAQMGVVCCSPTTNGALRLRATVGGTVRAEAVVKVDAPGAGGLRPVTVQDWQLCGGGGCPPQHHHDGDAVATVTL